MTDAFDFAIHELVVWEHETEISTEDFRYSTKDVLRAVRWVGNSRLNEVFEAMACAEIESVQHALLGWLDSIDAGRNPALHAFPGRRPQLCLAAEATRLLKWKRTVDVRCGSRGHH